MLVSIITTCVAIILAYTKFIAYQNALKWLPVKRGDIICSFTGYNFLSQNKSVEIYGTIIQTNIQIKEKYPLKYYKTIPNNINVSSVLKNYYPLNIPFNCTINSEYNKFRMLVIPFKDNLLEFKFTLITLFIIFTSWIASSWYFNNFDTVYFYFALSFLYIIRNFSYRHDFTFQLFSNGHVIELY